MDTAIKKLRDLKVFPIAPYLKNSKFQAILRQVYPVKQKYIQALLEYSAIEPGIRKIILFGSSITMRCRVESDIDVMVWLDDACDDAERDKISGKIGLILDNADVLFPNWFEESSAIWNDIYKGVTVYEQAV